MSLMTVRPEAVAELFGGKPLAVVGRSGKLLFREECVAIAGAGFEEEGGVADGHGWIDRALIVVRNRSGIDVTLHGSSSGRDPLAEECGPARRLCRRTPAVRKQQACAPCVDS